MTEKQAERRRIEDENRERRERESQEHRARKEKETREWKGGRSQAWQAFLKSQPNGQLPEWLQFHAQCLIWPVREGLVRATIVLWKKQVHESEYQWEAYPDEGRWLIRIYPKTGRKIIRLAYMPPPEELVEVFQCTVEFPSQQVTVLLTTDAATLDYRRFELISDALAWG